MLWHDAATHLYRLCWWPHHDQSQTPAWPLWLHDAATHLYRLCWWPHHDQSQTPAWPLWLHDAATHLYRLCWRTHHDMTSHKHLPWPLWLQTAKMLWCKTHQSICTDCAGSGHFMISDKHLPDPCDYRHDVAASTVCTRCYDAKLTRPVTTVIGQARCHGMKQELFKKKSYYTTNVSKSSSKYLQRLKSYHICVFIVIYPWKPQWLV